MSKQSARAIAVHILDRIEQEKAYSNIVLNQALKEENMTDQDRSLLTELVYGVIQNKRLLDYYLSPYVRNPKKLDNWVKQVLRLGVYQLVFLDTIPAYAAISEAVNYTKKRGHRGVAGFVNGVLRNVMRHPLKSLDHISSSVEKIGIKYSLPQWLVTELINDYDEQTVEYIANSFNKRAKVSIRVNVKRLSRKEVMSQLEKEGFDVSESRLAPEGIIVHNGLPVNSSLFKQGIITIQDESSMLVAPALEVAPSDYVLDACAAPGGKSSHIATYLEASVGGCLLSSDIHKHKIPLIESNLSRQQLQSVSQVDVIDARKLSLKFKEETFDKILIDAPCSGIGLLRRKPDIRYHKKDSHSTSLSDLQLSILNEAAKVLKVGGRLIYSTCTILKKENQHIIQAFLQEHKNFQLAKIKTNLTTSNDGMLTILPHQFDSDGFFIAALEKIDQ